MIAEAIQRVRETPVDKFESGCAAHFVPFIDGWGIKFYTDQEVRDDTHYIQNKAFNDDVAPEVGDKIDFTLNNFQYYGYLTKMVRVCMVEFAEERGISYEDAPYHEDADNAENEIYDRPEYFDLIEKMNYLGMDTGDMHWANVGYTPDGRMLAIDFHY
jgi:hypothetical protein